MGNFFRALFTGFLQAVIGLFSKSTDYKLGAADVSNKDLAEQNNVIQQELKVANQGQTISQTQQDLNSGRF